MIENRAGVYRGISPSPTELAVDVQPPDPGEVGGALELEADGVLARGHLGV